MLANGQTENAVFGRQLEAVDGGVVRDLGLFGDGELLELGGIKHLLVLGLLLFCVTLVSCYVPILVIPGNVRVKKTKRPPSRANAATKMGAYCTRGLSAIAKLPLPLNVVAIVAVGSNVGVASPEMLKNSPR